MASCAAGRGLTCLSDVGAGALLARLPLACCTCTDLEERAWPARLAAALQVDGADPDNAVVRALRPRVLSAGALASYELLEQLQSPPLLYAACDRAWELSLLKPASVSERDWLLALSHSLSRTCRPDGAPGRLVVPLFELANDAGEESAELSWEWENGALELRAARALKAGEEARISYGPLTNSELFLSYGFARLHNEHDTLPVFGSLHSLDRWLTADGGVDEEEEEEEDGLLIGAAGSVDTRLVEHCKQRGADAAEVLRKRAAELLAAFPTSIAEDERLLAAQPGGLLQGAITLRLSRKHLLQQFV